MFLAIGLFGVLVGNWVEWLIVVTGLFLANHHYIGGTAPSPRSLPGQIKSRKVYFCFDHDSGCVMWLASSHRNEVFAEKGNGFSGKCLRFFDENHFTPSPTIEGTKSSLEDVTGASQSADGDPSSSGAVAVRDTDPGAEERRGPAQLWICQAVRFHPVLPRKCT